MLTFDNVEFVLFDVETTGLSPTEGDRIIEFAALKVRRGVIVDRLVSMINPGRPLAAQEIHGISEAMLKGAPTSAEALPPLIDFLGNAALVAHNASFDVKFLANELALAGRRLREQTPVLDTIKMAKSFLPHLTSYRLTYLATSLGISVELAHRAEKDTELLAKVFGQLLSMAPDHNMSTLSDLVKFFSVEKPVFKLKSNEQPSLF